MVALWNSNTSQPGGLEFEVMDMLYHLPFRDWMELDKAGAPTPEPARPVMSGESGGRREERAPRLKGFARQGDLPWPRTRHARADDPRGRAARATRASSSPSPTGSRATRDPAG